MTISAGLIAAGDISLPRPGRRPTTGLKITSTTTPIAVTGFTDLAATGSGTLNVNVAGTVNLTEVSDDMRLGLVRSRENDVTLFAPGSILDGTDTDPRNVAGVNIQLLAFGNVGISTDLVRTDLLDSKQGVLTALALVGSIFIDEVSGDLRVNQAASYLGRRTSRPRTA